MTLLHWGLDIRLKPRQWFSSGVRSFLPFKLICGGVWCISYQTNAILQTVCFSLHHNKPRSDSHTVQRLIHNRPGLGIRSLQHDRMIVGPATPLKTHITGSRWRSILISFSKIQHKMSEILHLGSQLRCLISTLSAVFRDSVPAPLSF